MKGCFADVRSKTDRQQPGYLDEAYQPNILPSGTFFYSCFQRLPMADEKNEDEAKKSLHWSELLAQQIVSEKHEPYVISGGMTTSGPTHLGTVCEFLFPQAIVDSLHYAD